MCCCNCKSRETIDIEVWPHQTDDDSFTSIIAEAIRQAEIRFGEPFRAEVQYVGSRYFLDPSDRRSLVHKFTATSPGIR